MGINSTTKKCKTCDDENVQSLNGDCTIKLDTSCIYYRWRNTDDIALNCLGLTSGTDLTTILEEIDQKLCEFTGFNLNGFDLGCLTEGHDIYSFQQFAEAISKEVCSLKEGDFQYKLDTINANLLNINKPSLEDTCIGYVPGDSIQKVLQKLLDKVCYLDSVKAKVVSSPDIEVLTSRSIALEACGEKNHTLKAEAIVSNAPGNRLKVLDSGMFVPSLSDNDIGMLLDRINSVPALKEKLCKICSFNQGVGGSSNNGGGGGGCQCTIKIDSIARYNGNNYSVVISTVNTNIAPYYWEVKNNNNIIIASGNTSSQNALLETFELPSSTPSGQYTVRFLSLACNCSDTRTFQHNASGATIIAPTVLSAVQSCTEDSNLLIVQTSPGSNPEMTIVVRNSLNQIIHTRTNNLILNDFEITVNGIYTVTVYDADNELVSSLPYQVNFTCIGTVEPPDDICVTYNVVNLLTNTPVTITFMNCDEQIDTAIIDPDGSALICMIRDSFADDDNVTFTEIGETCTAICAFDINEMIIEC